jgi:CubicO group peptidase (beta-lactamase class C family)
MLIPPSAAASVASAQQQLVSTRVTAGAQTTVVVDGKIAFTEVAGVQNLKTGAPVTPRTLYHVGSITKLSPRCR